MSMITDPYTSYMTNPHDLSNPIAIMDPLNLRGTHNNNGSSTESRTPTNYNNYDEDDYEEYDDCNAQPREVPAWIRFVGMVAWRLALVIVVSLGLFLLFKPKSAQGIVISKTWTSTLPVYEDIDILTSNETKPTDTPIVSTYTRLQYVPTGLYTSETRYTIVYQYYVPIPTLKTTLTASGHTKPHYEEYTCADGEYFGEGSIKYIVKIMDPHFRIHTYVITEEEWNNISTWGFVKYSPTNHPFRDFKLENAS